MHGWVNLAPFSWDVNQQKLFFAMRADDIPVDLIIRQAKNSHIVVEVKSLARLNSRQKDIIHYGLVRSLDLATHTNDLYRLSKSINKQYGNLVKKGAGRILRAPSLWEDAAKTIFTTNCSWSLTQQMSIAACSSQFSSITASGLYPFPAARKIARISEDNIKNKMRVGYRAKYIKKLASQLSNSNKQVWIENLSEDELRTFFLGLEGFGPYAANHMMILSGFYTQIPVDTVVKSYIQRFHHSDDSQGFIESHFEQWGQYKWWGLKLEQITNNANWLGD